MSEKQAHQATEGHISGQANEPMTAPAHALSAAQVVEELQTDSAAGLTVEEASLRLSKYGVNDFEKEKGVRPLQIFIAQIVNSMVMVLLLALAASFAIQAWIEGGVLAALILINVVIGFFQDLQAARTIASLQSLNSPTANVIRGGASTTVEKATLVPGDIIELKTGDMVPADVRLLDTVNLEADEALLTGESVPARKDPKATFDGEDTGPGDRLNVAFSSTTITKGRGRAVVFATGMSTEIGAIAAALHDQGGDKRKPKKDADGNVSLAAHSMYALGCLWDWCGAFLGLTVGTPLQRKLSRLFLYIFMFAIVCALIVLGANGMKGRSDVIIYAVATAIGTLPVTLILVLTITMAAGTKVMVERNVLVRNMRSLEALGGVTNICSDKTGTLTQGKMVVRMAWLPSLGTYSVGMSNEPYNPEVGGVSFTVAEPKDIPAEDTESAKVMPLDEAAAHSALRHYLDVASLANLATVQKVDSEDAPGTQVWKASGDPTEIAIQVLATRFGRTSPLLASSSEWKQLAEFPFDSAIKKMSVLFQNEVTGVVHAFTKGAVERVIDSCTSFSATSDGTTPMTDAIKADILANMEALARRGLRVLALASKSPVRAVTEKEASSGNLKRDEFEDDLIFRGLVGIYDPPRPESRPSVFKCHQAGIGVHMLTGDHPETARAIAGEVGILPSRMDLLRRDIAEGMVMTAHDFDQLTDEQVDQLPELPLVVARCAPSTKVRMIDALHRRGRYVAMTGDGVNDSPSLHRADVGIAMGEGGSDVAKSASDIVLSDDNFASILNAVEEGRRIFDNVQKFMLHVLAANVGFVTTLLIGLAYKDQDGVSIFQLTPVEILFMLLVAGAFTETGLGFESASPDILNRPPQSLKYGVFTPEFLADIAAYGVLMAICILSSFVIVIFGFYGGNLGRDCNLEWSEQCNDVFRARSTCYTAMMWIFLFFAWELVDSRRSFFDGMVSDTRRWAQRLWRNKFLFWSVILGTISVFPTLYIPVIDHVVFLHDGIDKEWGIAIAMTALFFAGAEGWKWAKRVYLRRHNLMVRKDAGATEEDLEARVFERFYQGNSDGSFSEK
ncbi:calcium-transporting ATPase [Verticillium alfalfae VaMs.102]|uniref:P-type Na(+) transporter n=1 Tax=Verticillium alfalfae (strain VaMs.102 / ATCC MYA-4576 / FGSC 10136) TaxID=526221 RepID=C9SCN1_VERA1|nr:calcium-transporting ATPase [Verticillium alfalfae VaMs.102]EEY16846.1 calcium-transporting ATPase [Verticillium alfalfae VaMs.102]